MISITTRARIGSDGSLTVHVPTALPESDVEVVLVVQPVTNGRGAKAGEATPEELGWPPGFFEGTAGAWQGDPLQREPQEEHQDREVLL